MTPGTRAPQAPKACFLLAAGLAVFLAEPSSTWLDGGELALAAWSLGNSHPPGQPAWILLGRLADLVPLGDLSFRLTMLSAICHGLAAALLARLASPSGGPAGWIAGALLAVCPAALLQATRLEVYAPAIVLLLAGASLAVEASPRKAAVAVLPLALVGAIHPVMLVAAMPAGLVLLLRGSTLRRKSVLLAAVVLLLPALGLYGMLPLRTLHHPPIDFLGEASWERLLWMVSGRGYARSFGPVGTLWVQNLLEHGRLLQDCLGWPALGLAALALLIGPRRHLGIAATLIGFGLLPTVSQGLFDRKNPDASGWLLVPITTILWLAGRGAEQLIRRTSPRLLGPVLLAALVPALLRLPDRVDRAVGFGPRDLAATTLDEAPPGATLLLAGDAWYLPALYSRHLEGRRPDLRVLALHRLPSSDVLRPPELSVRAMIDDDRPLLVNETLLPLDLQERARPGALLRTLVGPDPLVDLADTWDNRLSARCVEGDRRFAATLGRLALSRAGQLRALGDGPGALDLLERAQQCLQDPWHLTALARYRLQSGVDPVAPAAGSARRIEGPWSAAARLGDDAAAAALLLAAVADDPDIAAMAAVETFYAGDPPGARLLIEPVLARHPTHALALQLAERLWSVGVPMPVGAAAP